VTTVANTAWRIFWKHYGEGIALPAAFLLRDATLIIIALALNAIIFMACKGFETAGSPSWFTSKLEQIDLVSTLINVLILVADTSFKIFVAAFFEKK
jgi:hypothetical protein